MILCLLVAFTFASVLRTKEEASKHALAVESKIGDAPATEQQFKKRSRDCSFCNHYDDWDCMNHCNAIGC